MDFKITAVIEEQISVQFTGKVNILSNFNRQYLGHLTFHSGDLIRANYQGQKGLKAFYQIVLQEFTLNSFTYIVEPEVVDESNRDILVPYAILKDRMDEVVKSYQDSLKFRPPENVKIVVDPKFVAGQDTLTHQEYTVLLTLTEWSSPFDIYQHSSLLDHEITWALVGLRKKQALKIMGSRNNQE
jgi:hypothetical protein